MIICGHRGASLEAPENTLGAFTHARALGLGAFELDVHLTKDRQCVVLHDATLDRTTTGRGAVADHTLAALTRLRANGPFPDWPDAEPVPTLDAMLTAIADADLILIEVKKQNEASYPTLCRELARLIDRHDLAGRAVIASAESSLLACARQLVPAHPRALIGRGITADDAGVHGCRWLMPEFSRATRQTIADAHARGLRVACWTPNTSDQIRQAAALQPDALITDAPSLAIKLTAEASPI